MIRALWMPHGVRKNAARMPRRRRTSGSSLQIVDIVTPSPFPARRLAGSGRTRRAGGTLLVGHSTCFSDCGQQRIGLFHERIDYFLALLDDACGTGSTFEARQ